MHIESILCDVFNVCSSRCYNVLSPTCDYMYISLYTEENIVLNYYDLIDSQGSVYYSGKYH